MFEILEKEGETVRTGKDIIDDGDGEDGPREHTESEMVFWGEGEIIVIAESEGVGEGRLKTAA